MMMAGLSHVARECGADPLRCPKCGHQIRTLDSLRAVFRHIVRLVMDGQRVRISDFGVFYAKVLAGRTVRSPILDGGEASFSDSLVLRFSQSKKLKAVLNPDKRSNKKPKRKGGRK